MREFVLYTAARFAIFGATYAVVLLVVWLTDRDGPLPLLWPLVLAAVLSTFIAARLLRDMRARFTQQIQERSERMSTRFEEMRAKEDSD
jgi:uncharacterized membrane protein